MFSIAIHFYPSLIFGGKAGALTRLHSDGRLLALSANIRLGWKGKAEGNTPAYYHTATIVAVESFIEQAPGYT